MGKKGGKKHSSVRKEIDSFLYEHEREKIDSFLDEKEKRGRRKEKKKIKRWKLFKR